MRVNWPGHPGLKKKERLITQIEREREGGGGMAFRPSDNVFLDRGCLLGRW